MYFLNFAIRNIRRHKKRSIVTIFIISLGFTALGVIGGILNNIFSTLKEQAIVNERLGHLTLAKEGFFKKGKINPEAYLWNKQELESILSILNTDDLVTLATPRLNLFGVASNGKSSTIFITEAVVPKDDVLLSKTDVDGRTERSMVTLGTSPKQKSDIAIGSELAENLNLKKGDYLTLLTSTKDGIANAIDVDITQKYNTGNPGNNDKFVLSNFYTAQSLYDTQGAQRIIVTVKTPEKLKEVESLLLAKLKAKGHNVESKTWEELSLTYVKVKKMFNVIFRVLSIIITVIVLLTLLNTMQMAVTERSREIGTIRAIGVLKKNVIKLFCLEGLVMGVIGCLIAVPMLFFIAFLLKHLNITFVPPVASNEVSINLMLKFSTIISVFVLFIIASIVSSFVASKKIANEKIIHSLSKIN